MKAQIAQIIAAVIIAAGALVYLIPTILRYRRQWRPHKRECSKCGGDKLRIAYINSAASMRVYCKRCGFDWVEALKK